MRTLIALSAAACASAQSAVWGVAGAWELVPATGSGPQGSRWHSAASTGGCVFVTGGAGAAGNATFQLDVASFVWTQLPSLPQAFLAPAVISFGGMLLMVGGETGFGASDEMLLLSTTNSSGGWFSSTIPGSTCGPRHGHKAVALGGNLYLLGGWDGTSYFNDVHALDLNSYLLNTPMLNGSPPAWICLVPNGAPGMLPARSAFSLDVYSAALIVFGGIWANSPQNPTQRVLFNDAWVWVPGNTAQLAPLASPGWLRLNAAGVNGNSLPPCRYGHTSGVYGDQLFVFGGSTWAGCGASGGPIQLNDLWALNLPSQEWAQVAQSAPWPSPRGVPAGVFVGRHLYVYGGDGVSSDMWRWAPTFSPSGSGGGPAPAAADGGLVAGIVVAILIGLANLGLLAWLALRSGGLKQVSVSAIGDVYAAV